MYKSFFDRPEWERIRYQVLCRDKFKCLACGASWKNGAVLQVDHIKPRSIYPELALAIDNLQTLCKPCNIGKSNLFDHDHRPKLIGNEQASVRRSVTEKVCIGCTEKEDIIIKRHPLIDEPILVCGNCWDLGRLSVATKKSDEIVF